MIKRTNKAMHKLKPGDECGEPKGTHNQCPRILPIGDYNRASIHRHHDWHCCHTSQSPVSKGPDNHPSHLADLSRFGGLAPVRYLQHPAMTTWRRFFPMPSPPIDDGACDLRTPCIGHIPELKCRDSVACECDGGLQGLLCHQPRKERRCVTV
ncbi:hypothetical protein EDB81DRAFT_109171 [Dactylonectria macrodidyma]|uniref:EGF-like domain-containing protein n=1 Tax=Dactylonectria macrodidyma TaxID=307937 RepID=A0A9P9EBT3_9HYPO|nr:hypothetical protein EDB81DRAFT_109171 [Dactylonectria macrodidyma]